MQNNIPNWKKGYFRLFVNLFSGLEYLNQFLNFLSLCIVYSLEGVGFGFESLMFLLDQSFCRGVRGGTPASPPKCAPLRAGTHSDSQQYTSKLCVIKYCIKYPCFPF